VKGRVLVVIWVFVAAALLVALAVFEFQCSADDLTRQQELLELNTLQEEAGQRLLAIAQLELALDQRDDELDAREAMLMLAMKVLAALNDGEPVRLQVEIPDAPQTFHTGPWPPVAEEAADGAGSLYNLTIPPEPDPLPEGLLEPMLHEPLPAEPLPAEPPQAEPELADPPPAELPRDVEV
jgi:hypothetical protein